MPDKYIIVGRQLQQHGDVKYLHPNQQDADGNELINLDDGDGAIPLTAEFIGKEIIDLSENGPIDKADPRYAAAVRRIKYALAVVPPPGHNPADPKLQRILENTQVNLEWETRTSDGQDDINVRTFVVPVPDTLAEKRRELTRIVKEPGFEPPLTYFLDVLMMKAYLAGEINGIIENLADDSGTPLPGKWQDLLKDKINDVLGSYEEMAEEAEGVAQEQDANVLTDPVSAFHRAVGIYITNMCD